MSTPIIGSRILWNGAMTLKGKDVSQNSYHSLRVFISSAQNREGETDWINIREKIKQRLDCCPYLRTFIIEEYASPNIQE